MGDETLTLTGDGDLRNTEPLIKPVWTLDLTSTYDLNDSAAITLDIRQNGILRHITIVIPLTNTTGTTSQILLKNSDGATIFDSGEIAENATHQFAVDIPLSGVTTVSLEPSAAAGTGGNVTTIKLQGV